jgi:hypothetical protein
MSSAYFFAFSSSPSFSGPSLPFTKKTFWWRIYEVLRATVSISEEIAEIPRQEGFGVRIVNAKEEKSAT